MNQNVLEQLKFQQTKTRITAVKKSGTKKWLSWTSQLEGSSWLLNKRDVVFLAAAVLLCMESVYDILKMLINFYEQNQKAL